MFKKYKIEIIIFLAALALRLIFGFFLYSTQDVNSFKLLKPVQSDGYYQIAYNLIHYKVFSLSYAPPIIPDSARTPGYPLMIAASLYIFDSFWPLVIAQIIVGSLLPVLGRRLSREIIPNNTVADIVAWLLVIEPVGILLSVWMISEAFFTFFLFLFMLSIVKQIKISRPENIKKEISYKIIGLAAFLLGLTTLIRPTTLYLPVILIPAWLIYRYFLKNRLSLKPVIVFLIIFILTLSPWFYRNYRTFGVASITSSKEDVMFGALAPSVLSLKNNQGYSEAQIIFLKSKGFDGGLTVNLDNADWFQRQAIQVLKDNPKELMIVAGISLMTFFTHDGMLTILGSLKLIQPSGLTLRQMLVQPLPELFGTFKKLLFSPNFFIILMRAFWVLITILLLLEIGRVFLKKKFTAVSVFALIIIAYFALTTISNGFGVNARFRTPINVFIFMFAVNFIYNSVNFYKQKFFNSSL